MNYEGGTGKIKNDNMANDAFYSFLLAAFTNTEKVDRFYLKICQPILVNDRNIDTIRRFIENVLPFDERYELLT